jgi:hypothetical protein
MICLIENGNHVSKIPFDYIISNKNPGFYFNSFSYFECVLDQGEYTIVCTSEEEKCLGRYYLEVNHIKNNKTLNLMDSKLEKHPFYILPYSEVLKGEWNKNNCRGYIRKENIHLLLKNPGFHFTLNNSQKVKFHLRTQQSKIKMEQAGDNNYFLLLYKIEINDTYTLIMDNNNNFTSVWGYFTR